MSGLDGRTFVFITSRGNWQSPFPLLAGIDMQYEHPHYMVEDPGAADLIAGGLGISRGLPG
jgi:hypothetical protein